MLEIKTLHSLDTEYSADSIEWCPHSDFNNYFVCGTYQLEEPKEDGNSLATPPCNRKGRIYLYKFERFTKSLEEVDRLETAAILDMKWLKQDDNASLPLLATADALGKIEVYALENFKLKLLHSLSLNENDDKLLALSLDWRRISDMSENNTNHILASDSKGGISLLSWSNERTLTNIRSWKAHNFEAWICAFDKWDKNRVYTGGDDTFLHAYDLRMESRILLNKSHMAGVTCLLSHPKQENILLTGSYDENLRIFDTRSMKQPLGEINLSGGIWRLKSHPLHHNMILAACMYHNFSVVDMENFDSPQLIGEYYEHKSICYGADWCLDFGETEEDLYMATCSFYDHKLCVASLERNCLK